VRAAWAVATLAFAGAAVGEDVRVVSPRAEAVAITIYRDGLALVTETRSVDLPADAVTLVFADIVETLLPQSAIVRGVGRPLVEANFGFDRLTPRTLLERSVGAAVTVTRTDPATGRVTRMPATVLAVGEGVLLGIDGATEALYCSGLPERLELAALPAGLLATPELSVRLAAGAAGPVTVQVSYLAHGFEWSSDYVAHLNPRSDRLRLAGWATLKNATDRDFAEAEVQLVAGRLNVLSAEEGGSAPDDAVGEDEALAAEALEGAVLRGCFAADLPARAEPPQLLLDRFEAGVMRMAALEEIVVTASRIQREDFGDYQLYRLPWRTDLGARQTKQVLFLDESAVRVERFYGLELTGLEDDVDDIVVPDLKLRFENTERQGLGQPLPRGVVRVFEPYAQGTVFAGEAEIDDTPVGLPVELVIGRGQNVLVETSSEWREGPRSRTALEVEHRIVNNKAVPIDFEVRHAVERYLTDAKVERTSKPMRPKYGDFAWRFVVPPGEDTLRYRLSAREPR
jgi:hypothetical protein